MSVATGPYQRSTPFVLIREIQTRLDVERNIVVSLSIANQVTRLNPLTQVSNYVYCAPTARAIELLTANPQQLLEMIAASPTDRYNLSLVPADFELTANIQTTNAQSVYSMTHQVTKSFPRNTKNIYALVVSYIETPTGLRIGNMVRETIMVNGVTPSATNLYRLADTTPDYGSENQIWPGSAHHIADTPTAGYAPTTHSQPRLLSMPALNAKNKDHRILSLGESLTFSPRRRKEDLLNTKPVYLSPATFSRNKSGYVHGVFSFNHLSFAQNNTNLGRSIVNPATLLSAAQIKDVVVYQKQTQLNNRSNSLTPGIAIQGGLQAQNDYVQVASLNQGLRILSKFNNNTIVNMSFIDKTTDKLSHNMVEYKIEIILHDDTLDSIKASYSNLSSALSRYTGAGPQPSSESIKDLIDTYIACIQFIFGRAPFRTISRSAWQRYLMAMMSVSALDAESNRELVIDMIQNFCVHLQTSVSPGLSLRPDAKHVQDNISNPRGNSAPRLVKVLSQRFQIPDTKSVGLNYIEASIMGSSSPVPTISYNSMQSRVAAELQKFSINNPSAGAINQVGFLTPQSVGLRANPVVVPTTSLENTTGNFLSFLRSNVEDSDTTNLQPSKTPQTNIVEIIAASGITAEANQKSLRKMVFDTEIQNPTGISSTEYLSSGSVFATPQTRADSMASGSVAAPQYIQDLLHRPTESDLVMELVNKSITNFENITHMVSSDSVRGSLALQKAQEDFNVIQQSDTMTNILNFGSIVQVQYLAEYGDKKSVEIGSQNWDLMTPAIYEKAVATGASLICRLVKISNTLDVPTAQVGLEPLASIFILGPAPSAKLSSSPGYRQLYSSIYQNINRANKQMLKYINSTEMIYAKNIPADTSRTGAIDVSRGSRDSRQERRQKAAIAGVRY